MDLSGKKTYLIAGGVALASFGKVMGWLDEGAYQILLGLLGASGLAALRAGVKKSGPIILNKYPDLGAGGPGMK